MIWSLWGNHPDPNECDTLSLIDGALWRPGCDEYLLTTFDAESYEEALRRRNTFMDWDPEDLPIVFAIPPEPPTDVP